MKKRKKKRRTREVGCGTRLLLRHGLRLVGPRHVAHYIMVAVTYMFHLPYK